MPSRTTSSWEPECSVPQTWFFFGLWLGCNISFLVFLGIIPFNPSGIADTDASAMVLRNGEGWEWHEISPGSPTTALPACVSSALQKKLQCEVLGGVLGLKAQAGAGLPAAELHPGESFSHGIHAAGAL